MKRMLFKEVAKPSECPCRHAFLTSHVCGFSRPSLDACDDSESFPEHCKLDSPLSYEAAETINGYRAECRASFNDFVTTFAHSIAEDALKDVAITINKVPSRHIKFTLEYDPNRVHDELLDTFKTAQTDILKLEIGNLYFFANSDATGGVYEFRSIDDRGGYHFARVNAYGGVVFSKDGFGEQRKYIRPLSELEGLKVGDKVYTYGSDGKVHSFFIEGKFPFDDFITIKSTQGGYRMNITLDGYLSIISNKQLFWRTADRARRLGK